MHGIRRRRIGFRGLRVAVVRSALMTISRRIEFVRDLSADDLADTHLVYASLQDADAFKMRIPRRQLVQADWIHSLWCGALAASMMRMLKTPRSASEEGFR